jgi:hypothetical protein
MWDVWVAGVNACLLIDPASAIAALNYARSNSASLVLFELSRTDQGRFECEGV